VAFVKDGFFVGEIVIESGVTQAQMFRYIVQSGGVVALFAERSKRGVAYLRSSSLSFLANVR
jgi:hypothetical protein